MWAIMAAARRATQGASRLTYLGPLPYGLGPLSRGSSVHLRVESPFSSRLTCLRPVPATPVRLRHRETPPATPAPPPAALAHPPTGVQE